MDNLTHSLVGLTAAKAGLERLSPYATTVCLLSANAADADFVAVFFGDRWTLLQHHRGITHSIVGTIGIGLLVALFVFAVERIIVRLRRRQPRIRLPGLLIASLIAAGTHPIMDWTNNYGVRPLLPWNSRWFYGDLVFIVDPYIWLVLGTVAFLLTSDTRKKTFGWGVLAAAATAIIAMVTIRGGEERGPLVFAVAVWVAGIVVVVTLRIFKVNRAVGSRTAGAALVLVILYWAGLAVAHHVAYARMLAVVDARAALEGEKFLRGAAMPIVATPFEWQSVVETDRAFYRFKIGLGGSGGAGNIDRFEKPKGAAAELISNAERTRPGAILLGFARFPMGQVSDTNCAGRTLVQLADLRYTEPGGRRGSFAVDIPVDCLAR
jgi:inner membrane protein